MNIVSPFIQFSSQNIDKMGRTLRNNAHNTGTSTQICPKQKLIINKKNHAENK